MGYTKLIFEIVEQTKTVKTKEEKIKILRENACPALFEVLKHALHKNMKWFTNVVPPYKIDESPAGLSFSSLYTEHKKFYIYYDPALEASVKGKVTDLAKKTKVLIQTLESIQPTEAKILGWMIEGTFAKNTGLTHSLVEEAFPGLLK